MSLTQAQTRAIDTTEKGGSVLSLLGATFVIVTFLASSKFRKPINRLVFIASWGNILTNVATMIGTSAIASGANSSLCQFQAFMIQWLMAADAFWTFVMALNVYLSFYHHYDANDLRHLEWKYALACYGIPLIPALIYCFVGSAARGKVYGDATLWCWVSVRWDFLRVVSFYGPAWIAILLTLAIYLRVGHLILRFRKELLSLGRHAARGPDLYRDQETPVHGIRRTDEVIITMEDIEAKASTHSSSTQNQSGGARGQPREVTLHRGNIPQSRSHVRGAVCQRTFRNAGVKANSAAIGYFKCALLFFLALLCTWVPSTVNRIYTLINPKVIPFGPSYAAGLVLPLQGFWNCVVYITTSLYACRCLWRRCLQKCRGKSHNSSELNGCTARSGQLCSQCSQPTHTMSYSGSTFPRPAAGSVDTAIIGPPTISAWERRRPTM